MFFAISGSVHLKSWPKTASIASIEDWDVLSLRQYECNFSDLSPKVQIMDQGLGRRQRMSAA